ncbi:PD-(D/E)XK motif protein [Luteimonas sp. Y-2-2-4F]|nr:PD-(D/E)XK motif protein [Luteimonas sp. Y-2-2-4F]MCD9030867.1 PD-(D/E)XK motif protein [Luteimonas sp. Y-2-2-4F]
MKAEDPWLSLRPDPALMLGRRIETEHALGIYWVLSAEGQPGMLIRDIDLARSPRTMPHPKGIALRLDRSPEGRPQLVLILLTAEDRDVFHALCRDVISSTAEQCEVGAATAGVFRRLAHWQSLLGQERPADMGPEEVRGLIGELWALDQLRGRLGFRAALAAWVAPEGHPQDFALSKAIVEVKTRQAGSRPRVCISSLEQLEVSHLPLSLLVIELTPDSGADGRSLNAAVAGLLEHASREHTDLADDFRSALMRRGYVETPRYDERAYTVSGSRVFSVRDGFPRLLRSMVDQRIVGATYILDLADLSSFECQAGSWLPQAEAGTR